MTRNRALYVVLKVLVAIIPYVPARVLYALASLAGEIGYRTVTSARNGILANLSVVLDATPRDPAVRRAAREAFRTDAKNWVDTLRIARVSAGELERTVTADGWAHLQHALTEGRGAVLVTLHLGNFDLVGQLLLARNVKLTIPVERVNPPELFDLLTSSRRSKGIDVVPLERASWAMVRALRRGEPVAIMGDRIIAGREIVVPFFRRPARLPASPAVLARKMGAPVLVAVGIRLQSGRFRGLVEPVAIQTTQNEEADERENTERIVRVLERIILEHPGQWLAFTPIWNDDRRADEAATIGQRAGNSL